MRRYMLGPFGCLIHFSSKRVVGLERPRHERREAAERVLELADRVQVLEQVVDLFDVAVHHGRRRLEAAPMGLAVHLEPGIGAAFLGLDPPAHARLRAPRRRRPASVRCPASQRRSSTSPTASLSTSATVRISDAVKKCGVTCGEAPARLAHDRGVVVERERRIVAALQQHGRGAPWTRRTPPSPAPPRRSACRLRGGRACGRRRRTGSR